MPATLLAQDLLASHAEGITWSANGARIAVVAAGFIGERIKQTLA